ncbi:unnamed protein product [Alopecurus aequalis]
MSSSPVAVAASDPGGNSGRAEPKRAGASSGLAGDSDVTMAEASEEAPDATEVKEEGVAVARGGVLTADDVREEAAAVADPLYATLAADMLVAEGCQHESNDGAGELDGRDGDDNLGTEAGDLAGQAERKPVPTGDVAESSELEENGVAHLDEGTQNGPENYVQCARYSLPPLDQPGFRVSDLVWGKVKSHPWWPGEIFDPSNASELALKHQKKGSRLVAYFGDNSFAWCDESQLKPFVTNYSQMEKQSSSDAFVGSVNYALEELSRRILSGMSCSCLPEELSDNGMSYMVENAGLKEGVTCSTVNRSEILTCFSPQSLLHYIKSLALLPGQGGDLLELVIACSQLTSLYRSKGCPELASFQTGSAWVEDVIDTSPTDNVIVEEVVVTEVPPVEVKPKRGRGRPRKHKPEDNQDLTGKKGTSSMSNNNASYSTPVSVKDFENSDANKKKRSLDSFEDSEAKSPTGGSFKIGECIRRAANQLTGPSSVAKSQNEAENAEFDVSSDDAANELTVEKCAKRRRMQRHLIADPKELFLQLCSVAVEPMDRYSSSATIISYFRDYRNYIVSATTEANVIEKVAAKRGRKKRVLPSPEVETTDHMQDSYWSGLSLHNHPIHSLKRAATNTRPRRKRKSLYDTDSSSVQPEEVAPKKQIQVIERSIIHVDEKIVDEWKPTALVLSFGRSTALPSETDLIKIFGRYGPLKESETEMQKNTNTVKIVFKKRADAERAFTVAGKYSTFGSSLRSYRLVNMPFSLGVSEPNKPKACPGDHGPEAPGPNKSEVSLDTLKVNQVDKTEKVEAVKASSGKQDETVKKTCQAVPVKESSGEQVETVHQACQPEADVVKKTRQIDAELTGPSDQTATASRSGQAKTIAQDSSQQVSTTEQASQDEAVLKDQSETILSGAATGAVQVVGAIEPAREEPLKKNAKRVTEADTGNEVPEETRVPMELQAQSLAEKPVEQGATGQTMEIQAPKEAPVEIPCDVKLENKALTEQSEDQVASEQVKVPSDVLSSNSPDVQGSEPQPEAGHTNVGKQTAEELTTAEGAVESKVEAPVEETVEDKSTAATLGEAVEGRATAEAPGDETENTYAAEALSMMSRAEAPGVEKQATEAGNTIDDVAVELSDKKGTTGEKTVEDSMVEAPEEKATAAERVVEGVTIEAPDENAAAARKPIEDATVEAPDEKATTAGKPVEDATVVAPDEKAEKPVEGATVEAPDEKSTTAEKHVTDATVEAPDEKAATAEKTVEDATVEAGNKKATAAKKTAEDDRVEVPDVKATAEPRRTPRLRQPTNK